MSTRGQNNHTLTGADNQRQTFQGANADPMVDFLSEVSEKVFKMTCLIKMKSGWTESRKKRKLFILWQRLRGLTSLQGPQAQVGLPVELVHTCRPRGGEENVPLLVPESLVMCCQLTLHIQVRHRWEREAQRGADGGERGVEGGAERSRVNTEYNSNTF